MKSFFLLSLSILATLLVRGLAEDSAVPEPWPADRYAPIRGQSPFALATPPAVAATPQASFAANWYVSSIARLGTVNFVTIKSRDLTTQFSLYGDEPDRKTEVVLAGVNWSDIVGKSTVTIRKGLETAVLEFNEANLRGPAPAPTAAAQDKPGKKENGTVRIAPDTGGPTVASAAPVESAGLNLRRRIQPIRTP